MPAELAAGQAVDEDVAGVVRDAHLLHHLAHREVGQVALPAGVGAHGLQAHGLAQPHHGLHGEEDGDGQLGEDEVEGDPQQRHSRAGAARLAVAAGRHHGRGGLRDVEAPHGADLPQHAHVERQRQDGQHAEHDDLGHPVPEVVEAAVEGRLAQLALGRAGADGPEEGLGGGQQHGAAQDAHDHLGGARRLGEPLAVERSGKYRD